MRSLVDCSPGTHPLRDPVVGVNRSCSLLFLTHTRVRPNSCTNVHVLTSTHGPTQWESRHNEAVSFGKQIQKRMEVAASIRLPSPHHKQALEALSEGL